MSLFQSAHASYSLNPLITVLEVSAKKVSSTVTIKHENDDKIPAAIELKVKIREIDIDGKIVYKEDKSTANFVIYPSQIILYPGDMQKVQVQWVGDTIPKKEIVYGLIAEPAPIKIGDEQKERKTAEGRVIVLTRYEGIIVVRPSGIQPNIVVDSSYSKIDTTGKRRLVLVFSNNGTALQSFQGMKLQITPLNSNGKPASGMVEYTPELSHDQTKHSLFAGFRRKLDMAWPVGVKEGAVSVKAIFAKQK
jgi:fimbrial chaperone protein